MLIQVKASAGSGKTHALTQRFLSLALRASRELSPACAAAVETGYCVPEILAVTFTNKAAAEMRERVLAALKSLALGLDGVEPEARGRARDELERLLVHAQRLNIRTIDSLLFLLARVFALELGLRPDFEPAFDDGAILADLYDRLTASLAEDPALERLFGEAASALLQSDAGFLPLEKFREKLFSVGVTLLRCAAVQNVDPEALRLALERRTGQLRLTAGALLTALDGAGAKGKANFLDFLRNCREMPQTGKAPKSSYAAKPDLTDCLLKASLGRIDPELERLFAELRQAHDACCRELPVLRGAMALAPFTALAGRLLSDFPAYLTEMRVLPHSQWPKLVGNRLAGDFGVPDAWCRMGAGLAHILIDEFQDTAREQWDVLRLLALECLSRGGSLYLVGDVKQAIYGWRGGDAALFDQAPADPELARITDVHQQRLPVNWRSAPAVVDLNNRFFAPLVEEAGAFGVAEALLGPDHAAATARLADALRRAFADASQSLPADRTGPAGHARITALPAQSVPEYEAAAREELIRLLTEEIVPRHGPQGVAVLTRSNPQAGRVAAWCIEAGIPVVTENSLRLADHPLIRQLTAMLAFLDYPPDSLSFWTFVSGQELFGDIAGISRQDLAQWLASLPRRSSLSLAFKDHWPEPWRRFIRPLLRQTGLAGPYDLLREIVAGYRLIERRPGDEAFIRRFLEIAHLAESRGLTSISAFLDFWQTLGDDEKVPQPENIGAVRVMTIHKAKGLQFPAVVVPFHHFAANGREPDLVMAELDAGPALAPDLPGLGESHSLRRARELAEQVHLLYVAWTRPELELHAFVPGQGKLRQDYPLPRALEALFAAYGQDPAEDGPILCGAPPTEASAPPPVCQAPPAAATPPPDEAPPPMAWLPRLKVYRNAVRDIRDALRFTEKRRGELAHLAAQAFVQSGPMAFDPEPAARRSAVAALASERLDSGLRQALTEEFTAMLVWLAGLPPCREALAQGLCERELLDANGDRHRPDLLHLGPNGTVILDFKTGREEAGHVSQVARYLALAKALPGRATLPARGFLVYLDRRECRPVEGAS